MTDWWLSHIKPKDVVVDIGANVGETSKAFLDIVGPRPGEVYAIEPAPECYKQLISLADVRDNFFTYQLAIGDFCGTKRVFHYRHWTLLPKDENDPRYLARDYHDGQDQSLKGEFTAQYITLDTLMWLLPGKSADVIKIDVDGAAYSVINGGRGYLGMRNGTKLILELGCEQPEQPSARQTLGLLEMLGYKFLLEGGEASEQEITSKLHTDQTIDIVCLPKARVYARC